LLLVSIPESDSVVTFDRLDEISSSILVEVQDCFRVGARFVLVPSFLQFLAQLHMVVDLAIEHQPHAIGATVHRLMTGWRKINDRQPAKPNPAAPLSETQCAGVVRTTMSHLVAHPTDECEINSPCGRAVFPDSANTTHQLLPCSSSPTTP